MAAYICMDCVLKGSRLSSFILRASIVMRSRREQQHQVDEIYSSS